MHFVNNGRAQAMYSLLQEIEKTLNKYRIEKNDKNG